MTTEAESVRSRGSDSLIALSCARDHRRNATAADAVTALLARPLSAERMTRFELAIFAATKQVTMRSRKGWQRPRVFRDTTFAPWTSIHQPESTE